MAYPTEFPETSGSGASSSVAPPTQATLATLPAESNDLMRLVDHAEASLHDHFQQIKNSLTVLHGIQSSLPRVKDNERKVLEKILQSEREQMAQQRAQEQEHLRATMQQLADAWLKLEQEQMAHVKSSTESPTASRQTRVSTQSDSPGWSSNESAEYANQEPVAEIQSIADLNLPRRPSPIAAMDSSTNEELFHKLRIDLLRQVK